METHRSTLVVPRETLVRLALATGLILLIPLAAGRLSDEVSWTLADFAAMGALLFGGGLAVVWSARQATRRRVLIGSAILLALVWVWAELAVGVITNWGS